MYSTNTALVRLNIFINSANFDERNGFFLAFIKKKVDGLLIGCEIKALRSPLGISQAQASVIFGGGPVAFFKYENDDVMQSEAMDKLLRVANDVPAAFKHLAQKAGVELAKPSPSSDRITYS